MGLVIRNRSYRHGDRRAVDGSKFPVVEAALRAEQDMETGMMWRDVRKSCWVSDGFRRPGKLASSTFSVTCWYQGRWGGSLSCVACTLFISPLTLQVLYAPPKTPAHKINHMNLWLFWPCSPSASDFSFMNLRLNPNPIFWTWPGTAVDFEILDSDLLYYQTSICCSQVSARDWGLSVLSILQIHCVSQS